MIQDILSVFRPAKSEKLKTFFIGQAVSIIPEYYRATNANTFETPIHGWTIKSVSGEMATLVRGNLYTTQKLHVEIRYLKSE
jgi:hypothetical protein